MLRNITNFFRLIYILWQFIRYDVLYPATWTKGFKFVYFSLKLARYFRNRKYDSLRWGQRIALALVKLGPSFIKFGQTLATRSDLIGDDVATDLTLLQDRLDPFSFKEAKSIVENETGMPINELFSSFDEKPAAAASIAQVHYATTMNGEDVAVKILRPQIETAFASDLSLF